MKKRESFNICEPSEYGFFYNSILPGAFKGEFEDDDYVAKCHEIHLSDKYSGLYGSEELNFVVDNMFHKPHKPNNLT